MLSESAVYMFSSLGRYKEISDVNVQDLALKPLPLLELKMFITPTRKTLPASILSKLLCGRLGTVY